MIWPYILGPVIGGSAVLTGTAIFFLIKQRRRE
jgi:hypothetical protein